VGAAWVRIDSIARWWAQASHEARFEFLTKAAKEGTPPLEEIHVAVILAESEAGATGEG
jgi:hypothetical protein